MVCFSLVASAWMSTMMASQPLADRAGGDLAAHRRKRVVQRRHEDRAHDVDDEHACAVPRRKDVGAAPRRAGRIVERAQEIVVPRGEDQRLALVPDVVARRHAIGAGVDEALKNLLGDAEAAGGVLAVDDDEVEAVPGDQAGQQVAHDGTPRAAHDVAEEEQPQTKASARISPSSVAIAGSVTSCGSSGTASTSWQAKAIPASRNDFSRASRSAIALS